MANQNSSLVSFPMANHKTCHFRLFVSFPAKKGLIDQSPRIGRTPIGKAISSYEPIGIEGSYYVLSIATSVLEYSEVCH